MYIYDSLGRIIGRTESRGDSELLYDALGRLVGTYNKTSNTTMDALGRIVGYGNSLGTLLPR